MKAWSAGLRRHTHVCTVLIGRPWATSGQVPLIIKGTWNAFKFNAFQPRYLSHIQRHGVRKSLTSSFAGNSSHSIRICFGEPSPRICRSFPSSLFTAQIGREASSGKVCQPEELQTERNRSSLPHCRTVLGWNLGECGCIAHSYRKEVWWCKVTELRTWWLISVSYWMNQSEDHTSCTDPASDSGWSKVYKETVAISIPSPNCTSIF